MKLIGTLLGVGMAGLFAGCTEPEPPKPAPKPAKKGQP
jgi:hypothetical protein